MSNASGVVTTLFSKKAGNRGGSTYSFLLNGDGDTWYNCGFTNPKLKEGDSISFSYNSEEYAPNKFSNKVDVSSIVKEEGIQKENKKDKEGGKPVNNKVQENWDARAKYWENKELGDVARQNIISYQAAFNTATTILTTMCSNNAEVYDYLAGNTAKTQKKPGAQVEHFLLNVEAVATEILSKFITGDEIVKNLQTLPNVADNTIDHTDGDNNLDD